MALPSDTAFHHFHRVLPLVEPEAELVRFVASLGSVKRRWPGGALVEALQLQDKDTARPRSLSAVCGAGPQPFHTDLAHWRTPCRFIAFACVGQARGAAVTYVLPWMDLGVVEDQLPPGAIFLIRNGRRSFYAPALDGANRFIRFDPGCMIPANKAASEFVDHFGATAAKVGRSAVPWSTGDVLVIDNWRALHARGPGAQRSPAPRGLLRVYFGDGER